MVGKSRLLKELQLITVSQYLFPCLVRCLEIDHNSPFHLIGLIIMSCLQLSLSQSPEERGRTIVEFVGVSTLSEFLPLLNELLDMSLPQGLNFQTIINIAGPVIKDLAPKARSSYLNSLLLDILTKIVRNRKLVILIDDLQVSLLC